MPVLSIPEQPHSSFFCCESVWGGPQTASRPKRALWMHLETLKVSSAKHKVKPMERPALLLSIPERPHSILFCCESVWGGPRTDSHPKRPIWKHIEALKMSSAKQKVKPRGAQRPY